MTRSFMVEQAPPPPVDFTLPEPEPSDAAAAQAAAAKLNAPFIDLRRHDFLPQTVKLLSEAQARRFKALVLEDKGDTFLVGFVDPWDLRAQDEIANILRKPVDVAVITPSHLTDTIERVYRKTEQIGQFAREVGEDVIVEDNAIDLMALSGTLDEADAPIVKLLQSIFDDAARVNASDIHFEPQEKSMRVRFRIDGLLHVQLDADKRIAPTLVVRLKLMAGLDIAERRLPQDGRFNVKSGDSRFDIRMSSMPTQFGESVVLRLLRQDSQRLKLTQIMTRRARLVFEKALSAPHGMILVTGPTGSGKTTTLYAAIDQLNTPDVKILTCEDPVEYRLGGVNQVQINEKIELTFARVLRSFLRQDPDILLVGEIRDQETADIAARAAMTGHLVLSTLHTNDAVSTPLRLIDMGVPGYLIASSLLAVVSQRLLRLNCPNCAANDEPTADHLEWFRQHVSEEEINLAKFRKGKGCVRCNGSGYLGRRGVFEIIEMTPELAVSLQHSDPSEFERQARIQIGQYTMERNAVELVLTGETTIDEAIKIAAGGEM
ncbi:MULTISPECIES: GspE/PulE family protein [Ramlibacter]|uniref:Type II/IV secretion system protein n=1 Tax=Ramlibacter aquaticus TaxID=2780094 RepID=A0ABR9SAB7_9BURK|nr:MULTISPECIES: GspE/PulE family protein [Ramlibacter]MBE7939295.1 type II/IV secretion system protein [Ramlibacter aquaticus]